MRRSSILLLLVAIVTSIVVPPPDGFTQAPYCKGTKSDEDCADMIISKLSVQEKVAQMTSTAASIDRLGVESWDWWNEGLHGQARTGYATVFPEPIGMASSWDPPLIQKVGDVISTEARQKRQNWNSSSYYGKKGLTIWAPNINILRDPRWGRGQETYGEDPFLTTSFGVCYIKGIQGPLAPAYFKAVATPKHYAAHSGPEPIREKFNAKVNAFDYEDTYIPAFRAAIVDGKAHSIMCSYNALNGVPTCADPFLLTQQLRDYWGFTGFVVSDCGAISDIYNPHHYTKTIVEAAAVALNAGTDLNCGGAYWNLPEALNKGLVNISSIDKSLRQLFLARIAMREAEKNVPLTPSPDDKPLAHEVSRKSLVLLKNEANLLPLPTNTKIAVVGPAADLIEALFGNYHGEMRDPWTYLRGFRKVFGEKNIFYAQGSTTDDAYSVTIPESAFRTADGQVGLDVEIYSNNNFTGTAIKRIDSKIGYDTQEPIDDRITSDVWSARWSGTLLIPAAGKYQFWFNNQGGGDDNRLSLWFDNKLQLTETGYGGFEASFRSAVSIDFRFEAIKKRGNGEVLRLQWAAPPEVLIEQAVDTCKNADVIVAVVGLTPDLEGEGYDRKDIQLPKLQENLVRAVSTLNKPLVVIYTGGGMIALRNVSAANAIIHSFYSGEMGGLAAAETVAGINNPGGKMPVTTYQSLNDLPDFENYSMKNRTYRFYDGAVQFPFGHGLSYTSFLFSDHSLSTSTLQAGDSLSVSVNVSNIGSRDGDEVVQVYVQAPEKSSASPMYYWLAGFERVNVPKGETVRVKISISPRSLSTVDDNGDRAVRSGDYKILIGNGQPRYTKSLSAGLTIENTVSLPK